MSEGRHWSLLLIWSAVLVVATTWPMPLHPVSTVIGHPEASVGCHIWVLWWAQHHLGDFVPSVIFYPNGADVIELYGSDLLSPLLLSPLPLSPGLLYNLWVALLLSVGGIGAAWLSRVAGASQGGAVVAATVWQTAPFFQHELLNGTSELIAAAMLPWFTGALIRTVQAPSVRWGAAVGLSAGAAVSLSAYNPFFLLLILALLFLRRVTSDPRPVFTGAMLRAVGAAAAVGSLFAGPVAWLHLDHGAGQTFSRRESWLTQEPPLPDSFADLLDWVDPRAADLPALMPLPGGEFFEYWTTCTVYLGLTALGLAIVGLVRGRGKGSARPFPAMLLVSVLIACGPFLRVGGELVTLFGMNLPMPGLTLSELFPPFIVTALHSYRYTAVAVLALSVLAGRAVRAPWWAGLVAIEALLLSPVPWPAPVTPIPDSPVLDALAGMPPGAVLTAPMERENLGDLGRLLIAQTVHGKPVHDGGIHRRAGEGAAALFSENPVVDGLSARGAPEWPGPVESAWSFTHLYSLNYRYILMDAASEEGLAWAEERLGAPDESDELWALWVLGEVGSP